jgi:hypothetical protein
MVDMIEDFTKGRESPRADERTVTFNNGCRAELDAIESLEMPDGTWAICDGERFWLHRPVFLQAPSFSQHLLSRGDAAHTRQLLAAALSAGGASRPRDRNDVARPGPSLPRYIYGLAGSYQTTHATPKTMRYAAGRLRANGNAALAQHCSEVADQESGHDELALKDLEALGMRSAEFVSDVRPRNSVELVALFERLAQGANPVSVLGYAYALERFALFKTQETIDAIEAIVPLGTMATRCLRVHSAIGSDARHVAGSIDVVARLSPADRIAVMHAAFETAAQITSPTDYPGDEAAGELLARYRR